MVHALTEPDELDPWLAAWGCLAETALEANPFYAPWVLLPALRNLNAYRRARIVLVSDGDELLGAFPLTTAPLSERVSVEVHRAWLTHHTYLGTPLLHPERAAEVFDRFMVWLRPQTGPLGVVAFDAIRLDGPFRAVVDEVAGPGRSVEELRSERPYYTRRPEVRDLDDHLSKKRRQQHGRQLRRLAELGEVTWQHHVEDPEAAAAFIEEFVALEVSGWKRATGTAFGQSLVATALLEEAVQGGLEHDALLARAMRLDGRAVAMTLDFRCGRGAVAYKVAHDRELRRFSPGMLLEVEALRAVHADPRIAWMDSCANAPSTALRSIWPEQRPVGTLVVSTGALVGDLVSAGLPLWRWARERLKRPPDE